MGVVIVVSNRSGFANSGTSITMARRLACKSTDVISDLRRTLLSRIRCSGSPSTKQLCSEPKFWRRTDSGSSDITHLHGKWCERGLRILRRRIPQNFLQEPAPRSQGCEVARVLIGLDTSLTN